MNERKILTLCLLSALGVAASPLCAQDSSNITRQVARSFQKPGVPYANLNLVDSISDTELKWYIDSLDLHEAQAAALSKLYEVYIADANQLCAKSVPRICEQSSLLAAHGGGTANVASAMESKLLSDSCEAHNSTLARLDEGFFSAIESFLTDSQLLRLASVRRDRERVRCKVVPSEYPGTHFDLIFELFVLQQQNEFEPLDPETFGIIADQYRLQSTLHWRRYCVSKHKAMVESNMLLAEMTEFIASNPDPGALTTRQRATQCQYEQCIRTMVTTAKRIHDLNRLYLDLVESVLPSPVFRELQTEFEVTAYPTVFPNPFDCGDMFERVGQIESLNDEGRESLLTIIATYINTDELVSKKMVDEYLQHYDAFEKHQYVDPQEMAEHVETMTKLQSRRRDNAVDAMKSVEQLLNPDQIEAIAPLLEKINVESSAHKPRTRGLQFFP